MIALEMILKLRDAFTKTMDKAEGKFKRSVKNIKSAWNSLVTLPNIVAGAAPIIITKKLVEASMEMEALEAKMTAALPTFGAAGREINFITEESDRLGLNLRKTATEYATFAAATTRTGLTVKDTRQIFSDMSEALVALKTPAARVSLVFQALTQMSSKGVVSMEELRRQLSDSLPAATEIGARAMGMTTQAFNDAVSNGEVMASEFLPKFAAQVKKELGGSFDLAADQMQASLNRMQSELFKFAANAGDVLKEDIQGGIDNLTKAIKTLNENSLYLKATYEALKIPLVIGANAFQMLGDSAAFLLTSIATLHNNALKPLVEAFMLNVDAAGAFAKTMAALAMGNIPLAAESATKGVSSIKNRLSNMKEIFTDAYDDLKAKSKLLSSEINKNFEDIATQMAKAWVASERASIKKTPGKTGAIESGTKKTGGGDGESEKERKARLKRLEKMLKEDERLTRIKSREEERVIDAKIKKLDEMQKLLTESQNLYESARINSIENFAQREIELLDNKYRLEREKYKENKDALVNIEKAYNVERIALDKQIRQYQKDSMKSWVDTVTDSLMTIAGENKKFAGLYKAAAIIQIIADTYVSATSAYKSMVQAYGAYGIPAGIAAAAVVTAAGLANAATVSGLQFAMGTRSFRTNGPQMIMVGDNPGGRERVTVRPESSQNVNGPRGGEGGNLTINIQDNSGSIVESFRRKIRAGGDVDSFINDLFGRARALGAVA